LARLIFPQNAEPRTFLPFKIAGDARAETAKRLTKRRLLIAAIVVPLLYVLSSGPMVSLAFTQRVAIESYTDAAGGGTYDLAHIITNRGAWWPKVYAPLLWIAGSSGYSKLRYYWGLFPVRSTDSAAS
jgi:hypothetical protein